MTAAICQRARASAIALEYQDARGQTVRVSDEILVDLLAAVGAPDTKQQEAGLPPVLVLTPTDSALSIKAHSATASELTWRLELEDGQMRDGRWRVTSGRFVIDDVPYGYHRLAVADLDSQTSLIVTPGKCHLPDASPTGERLRGISLQLYLLRSETNFGIGDFGDLSRFASMAGAQGCDVFGVNPLHQMFLDAPERASPYSPVSRYFLNVLYIDLRALPEWSSAEVQETLAKPNFSSALAQCREALLVDYTAATRLKLAILRAAYIAFMSGADRTRRADFHAFVAAGGARLRNASLFQALRFRFASDGAEQGQPWPEEYRKASSAAVAVRRGTSRRG